MYLSNVCVQHVCVCVCFWMFREPSWLRRQWEEKEEEKE